MQTPEIGIEQHIWKSDPTRRFRVRFRFRSYRDTLSIHSLEILLSLNSLPHLNPASTNAVRPTYVGRHSPTQRYLRCAQPIYFENIANQIEPHNEGDRVFYTHQSHIQGTHHKYWSCPILQHINIRDNKALPDGDGDGERTTWSLLHTKVVNLELGTPRNVSQRKIVHGIYHTPLPVHASKQLELILFRTRREQ